jgi:hypothetical protein
VVLSRTGNRTGERAAGVPDGELVVFLDLGFRAKVWTEGHRTLGRAEIPGAKAGWSSVTRISEN